MRLGGVRRRLFDLMAGMRRLTRARPGTLKLKGLNGKVDVLTDRWGVPHIYAGNAADLFFAQGYVTARDRLFQIDYNRHAVAGRLCELVGRRKVPWRDLTVHLKERTTYDVDVMLRTFGMARTARESVAIHSQEARDMLAAYAAGVNAFIATGERTLEYTLLRADVAPWEPVHSLMMIRGIGFELNYSWRAVLLGSLLQSAGVPEDVARVIWPHFPHGGPTILKSDAWTALSGELLATREAANDALGFGNAAGMGSNCFAVAGSHSKNGDALLANDTHLAMTAPVPWHEVRLSGGGFDLHGFALAGVPGVSIGRTPHHAWGVTAGLVQDCDLFLEQLHPDDPTRYLTPDGWQSLLCRRETFAIRGEGSHERNIFESRHGPLLETVATLPSPGYRLAAAWAGHAPGRDLDALLGVWRALSPEDFHAALADFSCPTFNITYADCDGRIAYVLAGKVPRRRPKTPMRPLEGWTGAWDWEGFVPYEHNPCQLESVPFIVTANNRVAPVDYPYELGDLFEPPNRFSRITEVLTNLGGGVTAGDLIALQSDTLSAYGVQSRDALLAVVGGVEGLAAQGPVARQAAALWAGWDGHTDRDSAGAAIGFIAATEVGREVVRRLAGDDAAFGFLEMGNYICPSIVELAKLSSRLAELKVDLAQVVRDGFKSAVKVCRRAMGNDAAAWRWGDIHPLTCKHRMDATPVGGLFNIGPEPAGGGPDTVCRGDFGAKNYMLKVAAAMRMVVSARDLDSAWTILPGGESGDRMSRHYDDQLGAWLSGRLKPAPMSKAAVEVTHREQLLPKA